jgi:hypothetical protein
MVSRPNQAYIQASTDPTMDPTLGNMDPDLAQLAQPAQRESYPSLSQAQEASLHLQLQAVAASEATVSGDMQTGHQLGEILPPTTATLKTRRLGRACDACSKRKVKCGENIPCKNCEDLGIECTFARPAKRRGPANKVAEDLKRLRTDDGNQSSFDSTAIVPQTVFSIESIGPFVKVRLLMFEWFTYLYPIYPFPPEVHVLNRVLKREDLQNKSFLALIASMLALLASTFPRLVQEAIPEAHSANDSNHDDAENANISFIRKCTDICLASRSLTYESLNVDDAATCFFLAITARLNGRSREFVGHLMESMSIVRSLGVLPSDAASDRLVMDGITKDLCLRLYWASYIATRYVNTVMHVQNHN